MYVARAASAVPVSRGDKVPERAGSPSACCAATGQAVNAAARHVSSTASMISVPSLSPHEDISGRPAGTAPGTNSATTVSG
ncbi:hypothetical protein [Streptomyces sp. NPDC000229]|uniref:hypothetical protein n=1 Tax=Streptomyces sp. NPDC000229 TaxID=3154247 RepID=UPI003329E152